MTDSKKDEKRSIETNNKKKKVWKSLGIIPYFRELSIVIIGVLVTLTITDRINNYNRQKEIRGMLTQIKEEQEENLRTLEWNQLRWQGEQFMFGLLQQHKNEPEKIATDTFTKYEYAIGAIYSPSFSDDSYELLKSSLLVQYVKDKDLLRRLSETYRELKGLSKQLSSYSDQKASTFLYPMMEKMPADKLGIWSSNDPSEIFHYSLQEEGFNKFIYIGQTILSPSSIFEDNKKSLQEVIQIMDKAGY